MKTLNQYSLAKYSFFLLSLFLMNVGCRKVDDLATNDPNSILSGSKASNPNANGKEYSVVNLVADLRKYHPVTVDPTLVNAWGIAFGSSGGIWVSSNEMGISEIYGQDGNILRSPVNIPPSGSHPTGQAFNITKDFKNPAGVPYKFFIATENGTIAGSTGESTITIIDRSDVGAVYKGITTAYNIIKGTSSIYAADFHNGRIDVFNNTFKLVKSGFTDPNIPAGYAPFNIRNIGNRLVVTYAKQLAPDNEDDEAGPGNGYVDIYNMDGSLYQRLASRGALNSPWGIELMNENFMLNGRAVTGYLIGNFGDGHISAYDMGGKYLGQLQNNNKAIVIDGLWALSFPPNQPAYEKVTDRLYFTAGPDDESHGIFGYIK
jgi:uncharacterized protein (TIGR03118 family)